MMDGVFGVLGEHKGKLAIVAIALLLLPPATDAVDGGEDLLVAANAPKHGETMSVAVSTRSGLVGGCGGDVTVEVLHQGIIEYPGNLGTFEMDDDCRGRIEIPYDRFADQNGQYLVKAHHDGKTAQTRVNVEKVVNWVYVRSFEEDSEERTRIDIAFDRALGQPLTSSVFSSGTLVVDITYEGCSDSGTLGDVQRILGQENCQEEATGGNVFHAEIPIKDRASTVIFVPWENLDEDSDQDEQATEGWYNVTATYHNEEAQSNSAVPMDPTVYNEDPPGNWFEVRDQ